jgi:hypothetical protein
MWAVAPIIDAIALVSLAFPNSRGSVRSEAATVLIGARPTLVGLHLSRTRR